MSKRYSSAEVLTALQGAGFQRVSQKGSHVKLRATTAGRTHTVIVKHPAQTVPAGTFASILRQAGLSRHEFDSFV
ncbi:MAG: type II toxin-antitoxin system HicA family toxin [Dehalococcoidia bacterium]